MQRQVYFISDGTGITAKNFANSILSQFPQVEFTTQTLSFVKDEEKALNARDEINQSFLKNKVKPLVFYTVVDENISRIIQSSDSIYYPLFEHFLNPLEKELNTKSTHKAGAFHGKGQDDKYKERLDAIEFTLKTDDGANIHKYSEADIILLGVSRCGKTPTSLYLALNFNVKTANYPIVEDEINSTEFPKTLENWQKKCFGLNINPMQLSKIRQERLPNSDYAEINQCKQEIQKVENMFFINQIPYVNTSNISIEEISAKIINLSNLTR